jgi:hypothetical protein
MKLETDLQRVLVCGRWWRFSDRVLDAMQLGDRVFVIFDYMAFPQLQPAPNLKAYDLHQNELWTAAHPINQPAAAYVNFLSETSLLAWNFACFRCTLDESSGQLIEAQFTK